MRHMRYAILVLLLAPLVSAGAEQKPHLGTWLDYTVMSESKLPTVGDIPYLLGDFEYLEGETPKVFVIDLNGDDSPDYFVESSNRLCGTGGCLYAFIDGKTKKRIGDFFGSPILVLDQKINGYPIIQSYAHLNADSGNFVTYVFDGKKYQIVANTFVEGKSLEVLFKKLSAFRKVSAPTPKAGS